MCNTFFSANPTVPASSRQSEVRPRLDHEWRFINQTSRTSTDGSKTTKLRQGCHIYGTDVRRHVGKMLPQQEQPENVLKRVSWSLFHLSDLRGAPPKPSDAHDAESPQRVHLFETGEQRLYPRGGVASSRSRRKVDGRGRGFSRSNSRIWYSTFCGDRSPISPVRPRSNRMQTIA